MAHRIIIILALMINICACASIAGTENDPAETRKLIRGYVVSAQIVLPYDPREVKMKIKYSNQGLGKSMRLMLPKGKEELQWFDGLEEVRIDGKAAIRHTALYPNMDPAFATIVNLEDGESFDLVFKLSDMYKIPEQWTTIEVLPRGCGGHIPVVKTGMLLKRRSDDFTEMNKLNAGEENSVKASEASEKK